MAGLVLDASIALALVMPDEKRPLVSTLRLLESAGALAPVTWRLEIANVLLKAERRKRISASFRRQAIIDLSSLPISLDPDTNNHAWSETLTLAERHKLMTYDAAYLELALREGLPLATLDERLSAAALRCRVTLLD
jgi:predicted nucleic acid-binding protein